MKTFIIIIIAVLIIAGGFYAYNQARGNPGNGDAVVCTLDAKLCPDGSYVGRIPPNCEFAACPTSNATSTATGTATSTQRPVATSSSSSTGTPVRTTVPQGTTGAQTGPAGQSPGVSPAQTTPPASAQSPSAPNAATVTLTDDGFVPDTVTIPRGGTVTFVNNSQFNMWVASNPHPQHTDYPGFDERTSVFRGGSWQFTFERFGTWGYHNHLSPNMRGTIIVE